MILGIGVDIVEVSRFSGWVNYSQTRLKSVFSHRELELLNKYGADEKQVFFASRFAAKEAAYKALSCALITLKLTEKTFSFQFAREYIELLAGTWEVPFLAINWGAFEEKIGAKLPKLVAHLSIAHEKRSACAFVVIEYET